MPSCFMLLLYVQKHGDEVGIHCDFGFHEVAEAYVYLKSNKPLKRLLKLLTTR